MAIYEFNPDDAMRFADSVGIKVKRVGDELVFRQCPFCRAASKDKDKFAINLKTGVYNCFRASCGAKGNMITLSKAFDFELPGYADEYYNHRKKYLNLSKAKRPATTDQAIAYMKSRGISEEITRKYEITSDKNNPDLILFPFYDENNVLQLVKYRDTKATKENGRNKEFSLKRDGVSCRPILFGMNHCNPEDPVLIMTEGQIDSLSVAEVGFRNAVSVPTGCNGFTWVPYCWDFIQQFKRLIVFGDHEHNRISLLDDMRKYFNGLVMHVRFEDYKDCKDANEILQKYGKDQIKKCIDDAIPAESKCFVRLSSIKPQPISEMESFTTGIKSLDRTLGGFHFGQLVILTGERGEGKSTLSNQFALFAAECGIKTFIYSGELPNGSLRDWVDHQAAGRSNLVERINAFGDTNYDIRKETADRIANWYSELIWIYQNQFLEDVDATEDQTVLQIVAEAAKQGFRFILIDNLMTALDDDAHVDLYRAQTVFMKQLVRIAKARNILIVLVAHQRKSTGLNRTADDVSGSANITNLADIVMTFGKVKDNKDAAWDREIRIQKNRLTGKMGKPIPIWFDTASRRLSDRDGGFDWQFGWEKDEDGFYDIGDEIENIFGGVNDSEG